MDIGSIVINILESKKKRWTGLPRMMVVVMKRQKDLQASWAPSVDRRGKGRETSTRLPIWLACIAGPFECCSLRWKVLQHLKLGQCVCIAVESGLVTMRSFIPYCVPSGPPCTQWASTPNYSSRLELLSIFLSPLFSSVPVT